MVSKEQRAHDIAIAIVSKTFNTEVSKYPSESQIFDIVKAYEHAYKSALNSFEEDFGS